MSENTVKVGAPAADERTDAERDRARPVHLPAGSFDSADLQKDLDQAALAKNDKDRDAKIADIVDKRNENPFQHATLGLNAGEKRVTVEDESLGVTEERVVFDPDKADEQEEALENAVPAIDPSKQSSADADGKKE